MITTEWGNPQRTVILCTFVDPWTWAEYHTMLHTAAAMFDSIEHDADYILDFSRGQKIPSGALTHLKQIVTERKPRRGILIMVDLGPLAYTIVTTLMKLYPEPAGRVRLVDTLAAAYTLIRTHPTEHALPA